MTRSTKPDVDWDELIAGYADLSAWPSEEIAVEAWGEAAAEHGRYYLATGRSLAHDRAHAARTGRPDPYRSVEASAGK